jgi:hypothetical protein
MLWTPKHWVLKHPSLHGTLVPRVEEPSTASILDVSGQLKTEVFLPWVYQRDLLKLRCRAPHLKRCEIKPAPRMWLELHLGSDRS